ncbi:hypothetical protein VOLCADRAFT_121017 [Volvox carteri f. nagariensis]|uniref:Gfo/Idh/MocA-like oxidoreductase N-terminal domain-containing protein n=1 Tax=Volvox carteri f. nagariensis TaxID=3068 RepID=D8TZH1_VOLCA|nr:uncharacterized protein VOLCADRAFT_121017 [Volvox carteri f. nagariensis]EFJ47273.1 hypothetical protein VOLCADRAFT_121017 [Volvox carteri f. nagariensis]|eukprot:XP_002951822.1 hypothetical protein VOLCADRAFT_121017 [Volvox carteri f. nagariensis]
MCAWEGCNRGTTRRVAVFDRRFQLRTHAHGSASDKPAGVVALTCFELRRQGLALNSTSSGDAVIIYTLDHMHAQIAITAAERRLHVLMAKPGVQTLDEYRRVLEAVAAGGVLVVTVMWTFQSQSTQPTVLRI